jgi:FKBP-type peptidyl-prolyl cis-trans isomerase SlyD
MKIAKDTVVSIDYELFDTSGKLIEKTEAPIEYLHGGYRGIFPLVERALDGKLAGESVRVRLEPDDAFGDYDEELLHVEKRDAFPANVEVGMRFEGSAQDSEEVMVYTVTDVADDKVVVDGNHPLAGQALDFSCKVNSVRVATEEETTHGHVHGPHGHHHH